MIKKIVWSFVGVLVIAVVIGLGYSYSIHISPLAAPIVRPDNSVAGGPISSVSASSITISKQDGTSATFSVTPSTMVISQVAAGQTGKSVADLANGTMVLVIPSNTNPATAQSISIVPIPAMPAASGAAALTTIAGTVTAVSSGSLTVATAEGPKVPVQLGKDTQLLSNVVSGQKGKIQSDIKAGDAVQVTGIMGATGIAAQSILFMTPLVQQPAK